ncbi:MAG: putative toxin-antitoxin system toxin component, PIN family [Bacteroidales bacterium]|nr:putative toxin-antitoxin system toxin component, PIN family [Bacteroidales bacterium]
MVYNYVFENKIEVCFSDDLFKEYLDVIHRPKFAKYSDFLRNAEFVLCQIERKAKKYIPHIAIDEIKDKDDNILFELALEAKADFIITGNTNDFIISDFKGTKIVTPKEYWENHRK